MTSRQGVVLTYGIRIKHTPLSKVEVIECSIWKMTVPQHEAICGGHLPRRRNNTMNYCTFVLKGTGNVEREESYEVTVRPSGYTCIILLRLSKGNLLTLHHDLSTLLLCQSSSVLVP